MTGQKLVAKLSQTRAALKKIWGHSGTIGNAFRVGDVTVDRCRALGGFHKPALTKAGRVSVAGYLDDGQKVKLYNAFTSKQVALRVAISSIDPTPSLFFPALLAYDDAYLVEEWIDGVPLNSLTSDEAQSFKPQVEAFLTACQSQPSCVTLAAMHADAFCYVHDYLLPRLQPWRQWRPVEKLLAYWADVNSRVALQLPIRLSHPDLSLANLVVQKNTGKLYVIDNELLGVGPGWLLDRQNSMLKKQHDVGRNDDEAQRYAALTWSLRLVGAALDAGDFDGAMLRAQAACP